MADNLLEVENEQAGAEPAADIPVAAGTPAAPDHPTRGAEASPRPNDVPEKFWDPERGEMRTDALLKSYIELERKLGSIASLDIPQSADEYGIKLDDPLLQSDADINARLHAAGFTRQQAQLVYDLAAERLTPMIAEVASVFEADSQIARLIDHFGGAEKWREASRQITAWGKASLPSQVYEALATTSEGVLAMHRMMSEKEPSLVHGGSTGSGAPSEAELKEWMRDPRYWRDQDPSFIDKVRQGFRKLYP
jgi:hypothetical protein